MLPQETIDRWLREDLALSYPSSVVLLLGDLKILTDHTRVDDDIAQGIEALRDHISNHPDERILPHDSK